MKARMAKETAKEMANLYIIEKEEQIDVCEIAASTSHITQEGDWITKLSTYNLVSL